MTRAGRVNDVAGQNCSGVGDIVGLHASIILRDRCPDSVKHLAHCRQLFGTELLALARISELSHVMPSRRQPHCAQSALVRLFQLPSKRWITDRAMAFTQDPAVVLSLWA